MDASLAANFEMLPDVIHVCFLLLFFSTSCIGLVPVIAKNYSLIKKKKSQVFFYMGDSFKEYVIKVICAPFIHE